MLPSYFVLVLSCLVFVEAEKKFKGRELPSYITACSKSSPDFNKCAIENGRKAIPYVLKGDPKYSLPRLSPFHVNMVEIKPTGDFVLILKDLDVYGMENLELKDLKIDPRKRHVEVIMAGSGIVLKANYTVTGHILVLPISGEGKCEFKYDGCEFRYYLDYDLVKKNDGNEYGFVKLSKATYTIKKGSHQLDNLFNGNKQLGDNMNKVLNDNFPEILQEVGGTVSSVIESISNNIVNNFLGKTPINKILLD